MQLFESKGYKQKKKKNKACDMNLFWEEKKNFSELEPAFCHLLPWETRVFAENTDRLSYFKLALYKNGQL